MLDLIPGGIQHSNLFLRMPLFDEIHYEGFKSGKVRKYKAIHEGQACSILALSVIRKDEDILWSALEDLINRSVIQAANGARGNYTFDLLTVDIHSETKKFNPNELAGTILNHSRKLTPGAERLVRYSSVYGILQKIGESDWGKIILKTSMEIFKDKPTYLDLLVKELIKNFEFSNDPGVLILHDLSVNPIFDPQDTMQQKRLYELIKSQIPKSIDFPPEVYIQDKNGTRELLSGSRG